jgi:hypothetical protein
LDPYPEVDRIVDRPIFNTQVDEMSLKHILSKPQYVGSFTSFASDPVGKLLWTRPISPNHGGLNPATRSIANNIELLHFISRSWRGSLNIHIQSVMNNKQQIKLRLIQMYNPPTKVAVAMPTYQSLLSGPSHLMEFTGGGQIQTITLPYLCRNQTVPCSPDLAFEALYHGLYYIFVAQPLANSSGSPLNVNFNIFVSCGDDFTFHGYGTEIGRQVPFVETALFDPLDSIKEEEEPVSQFFTQGLNVMNEPQDSSPLERYSTTINRSEAHQERLISPIDVRPIIRRMYHTVSLVLTAGTNVLPLEGFVGEKVTIPFTITPMQMVTGMYYGKSCGLKIKLKTTDDTDLTVKFVPPHMNADNSTGKVRGSVIVPPTLGTPIGITAAGFPFPVLEMSQDSHGATKIYEFVVPDASFFKFVGGPEKYSVVEPVLASSRFGTLLIYATKPASVAVYVGMTDESRLGFHAVAPLIQPATLATPENGNATAYKGAAGGSSTETPLMALNPFLYYSRT